MVFRGKSPSTSLESFAEAILVKKCSVVVITPVRIIAGWRVEHALLFRGMESEINDATLTEYRAWCFTNLDAPEQTRKNSVELLLMAERGGDKLKGIIPDLIIEVMDLDGKPMSAAERKKICALAEGMNISI